MSRAVDPQEFLKVDVDLNEQTRKVYIHTHRRQSHDDPESVDESVILPCQYRQQNCRRGNDGHGDAQHSLATEPAGQPATRNLHHYVAVEKGG